MEPNDLTSRMKRLDEKVDALQTYVETLEKHLPQLMTEALVETQRLLGSEGVVARAAKHYGLEVSTWKEVCAASGMSPARRTYPEEDVRKHLEIHLKSKGPST